MELPANDAPPYDFYAFTTLLALTDLFCTIKYPRKTTFSKFRPTTPKICTNNDFWVKMKPKWSAVFIAESAHCSDFLQTTSILTIYGTQTGHFRFRYFQSRVFTTEMHYRTRNKTHVIKEKKVKRDSELKFWWEVLREKLAASPCTVRSRTVRNRPPSEHVATMDAAIVLHVHNILSSVSTFRAPSAGLYYLKIEYV